MHSTTAVSAAFDLAELGATPQEVARQLGIPHTTVRRWLKSNRSALLQRRARSGREHDASDCIVRREVPPASYAYLLGLYLGDGHLARHRRGVYRLRITCCNAYPQLMDECAAVIAAVLPGHPVGRSPRQGCTDVSAYSTHWCCLLPQHGDGPKHDRPIELAEWQRRIVEAHPRQFLRGLLHSDGCRSINRVTARGKQYAYPRYFFSNTSDDIRSLFCWACDLVGVEWRQNRWNSISVARRSSVALLDSFVGPKR